MVLLQYATEDCEVLKHLESCAQFSLFQKMAQNSQKKSFLYECTCILTTLLHSFPSFIKHIFQVALQLLILNLNISTKLSISPEKRIVDFDVDCSVF